ncbi:MAG: hypothetical protein M3Y71_03990 [Actinomycetota bacterium]|nr:hypothetical protein [Actinomycetota bacterium]
MSELPTPRAARLQRPSWRDSRLVVGVVIVLAATALGARAVASADDTVPMYVAAAPIRPGDRLTGANLRRVDVQLGDTARLYLPAAAGPPADGWARTSVPEGHLVPSAAVGSRADIDVQQVAVKVDTTSASGLGAGAVVDVWVSERDPATTQERYLAAKRLLQEVTVAGVPATGSGFAGASAAGAVQLLVPRDRVGEVIGAMDSLSRLTLVPAPGGATGS